MDEIMQTIAALQNTLRTVKCDDDGGNWAKLVGCLNALERLKGMVQGLEVRTDGDD